ALANEVFDDGHVRWSSTAVTPDTATTSRLPSNGTNYTAVFSVQNTGGQSDSYDLLTTKRPGSALTVMSITGSGVTQGANPDSARIASLGVGAAAPITVTYRVGNVAAGMSDTLFLTARTVGSAAATLPAGVSALVQYTSVGDTTWTYVPASGACSGPAGYDGCVTRIRWRLQNPLSYAAPNNAGTLQFVAQIR